MNTSFKGSAVRASFPWTKSGEKKVNPLWTNGYVHDTQAQISMCLNCQLSHCINCVDSAKRNRQSVKREQKMCLMRKRFIELYNSGVPKKAICAELGVCDRTYYVYRTRYIMNKEKGELAV